MQRKTHFLDFLSIFLRQIPDRIFISEKNPFAQPRNTWSIYLTLLWILIQFIRKYWVETVDHKNKRVIFLSAILLSDSKRLIDHWVIKLSSCSSLLKFLSSTLRVSIKKQQEHSWCKITILHKLLRWKSSEYRTGWFVPGNYIN